MLRLRVVLHAVLAAIARSFPAQGWRLNVYGELRVVKAALDPRELRGPAYGVSVCRLLAMQRRDNQPPSRAEVIARCQDLFAEAREQKNGQRVIRLSVM